MQRSKVLLTAMAGGLAAIAMAGQEQAIVKQQQMREKARKPGRMGTRQVLTDTHRKAQREITKAIGARQARKLAKAARREAK